jgi:zinc protease
MTTFRYPLCAVVALAIGTTAPTAGCKRESTTEPPITVVGTPSATAEPPAEAAAPDRVYPDPPPPSARKPVNFPAPATFTLANGLTVYLVRNDEVPTVTAQLVVRCGAIDGEFVAPFTASMLGEGTTSRSKAKLDEAIEFVGGTLGAGAGLPSSTVWSHVLAKDAKLAMVLMADEVINPTFPPASLEKLKQQAIAGLGYNKSQPDLLAAVLFDHVVYPEGHPYGRLFPTPEQIEAISVEDLRTFHRTFYRPSNSYLILAGALDLPAAKALAERGFGRWAKGDATPLPANPLNAFTDYEQPAQLTVHIVDRPGSTQTHVRLGNLAIARNHPDWVGLQVANAILGDDATGRLFQDLREERGLTYGIYSSVEETQAPGTFTIATQTRTETTGEMLGGIFEHVGRMRSAAPTTVEFESATRKLAGQFPLEIETPHQIADKMRDVLTYALPTDYWTGYWDEFSKIDADDMQKIARKYMHPSPNVVLVGDGDKIEQQVGKVLPKAKIVRWNTELERTGK